MSELFTAQRAPLQPLLLEAVRLGLNTDTLQMRHIQSFLGLLRETFFFSGVSLRLLGSDGRCFALGVKPEGMHDIHLDRQTCIEGRALEEAAPLSCEAYLYVPLTWQGRQLGVLRMEREPSGSFDWSSESGEVLLQSLCRALDAALRNDAPSPMHFVGCGCEGLELLYRASRGMHGLPGANELMHFALSSIVAQGALGFRRAMLLLVNHRSAMLQGMLGVTTESAAYVLPDPADEQCWFSPNVSVETQLLQRQTDFCRAAMQVRFTLSEQNHPLAICAREGGVRLVVPSPGDVLVPEEPVDIFSGSYVCAPLSGRSSAIGVLVVQGLQRGGAPTEQDLHFIKLFAGQVGQALENSRLIDKLERAHGQLHEAQERMLQNECLAAVGEMSASMAHELRNPLLSLGGYAQRLARLVPEQSKEQEYASIIAREVRQLEKVLSGILNFTRKQILCYGPCSPKAIFQEALELEGERLQRQGILVVEAYSPLALEFQGDAPLLRQVLLNLIGNARQAMADGGALHVRTAGATLRGDAAILFEVEDTGGGISPEVMRNIFNPFFTTRGEGTGLGLPISHRIVDLHRGEIEVTNRLKGACFRVRVPVVPKIKKEPLL